MTNKMLKITFYVFIINLFIKCVQENNEISNNEVAVAENSIDLIKNNEIIFDHYIGGNINDSLSIIFSKDSIDLNYLILLSEAHKNAQFDDFKEKYVKHSHQISDSINVLIYDIDFTYYLIYIYKEKGVIYINNIPHYGDEFYLRKHPFLSEHEIKNFINFCKKDCLERIKKYKKHDFVKFEND